MSRPFLRDEMEMTAGKDRLLTSFTNKARTMQTYNWSPMSAPRTLDKLIQGLAQHAEYVLPKHLQSHIHHRPTFRILLGTRFICCATPHDTGCSVTVDVLSPDGSDILPIIQCTYWYSSLYTFNKSYQENGAWDKEFTKLIDLGWQFWIKEMPSEQRS